MKRGRIKVTLYNRTLKEIDMSDFSYISFAKAHSCHPLAHP